MIDNDDLRQRLRHVLWIGGSTCAGKSTSAAMLAERHGLSLYQFDRQEPFHIYRSVPERQPHLIGFMASTTEERWVLHTPEEMARETLASWGDERFPMVIDDLLHMTDAAILAEGPGLFPEKVAPLLSDPRQAIWFIATPGFIRHVRSTRGAGVAAETSDPKRAFENLVQRDVLIAEQNRRQANTLGMRIVDVDEGSISGLGQVVEEHFAPLLRRS